MGRTRLFHTVVIVGSSLLANCEKGPAPVKKGAKDAATKDAAVVPRIMADVPDPPRIHAMTPEKMGEVGPAPPPVRIMIAPPPPRIQIRRAPKPQRKPPKVPRI